MEVQSSVQATGTQRPHVVFFPFPAQGHVRPTMQFAQRLSRLHGFRVTFVTVSYIYKLLRLQDATNVQDGLHFVDLQEGFPDDYFTAASLWSLLLALTKLQPKLQECVGELLVESPITCIICDLTFLEPHKTANHFGLPSVGFSCQCALAVSAKCAGLRLVEEGLLPLPQAPVENVRNSHGSEGAVIGELAAALAREVKCVPGIHPMRLGEYHSSLLVNDISDPLFQYFSGEQVKILHSLDWILVNTFENLEKSVIEGLQQHAGVKFTPVGPLALDPTLADENLDFNESSVSSFWPEEKCLKWLDKQNPLSVVYLSFGSMTHLTKSVLEEFALGLEDSQVPFLLVARPNLVDNMSSGFQNLPPGFVERTKERALVISWAPQLKVLGHPAVAGFITHCGWNSTLESISMGVPMLTYPHFADQLMINRYLLSVWKSGWEFQREADGSVGRHEVAKKVRALVSKDAEVRVEAVVWKDTARKAVGRGGSSYNNMAAFVADMYERAQSSAV